MIMIIIIIMMNSKQSDNKLVRRMHPRQVMAPFASVPPVSAAGETHAP